MEYIHQQFNIYRMDFCIDFSQLSFIPKLEKQLQESPNSLKMATGKLFHFLLSFHVLRNPNIQDRGG